MKTRPEWLVVDRECGNEMDGMKYLKNKIKRRNNSDIPPLLAIELVVNEETEERKKNLVILIISLFSRLLFRVEF